MSSSEKVMLAPSSMQGLLMEWLLLLVFWRGREGGREGGNYQYEICTVYFLFSMFPPATFPLFFLLSFFLFFSSFLPFSSPPSLPSLPPLPPPHMDEVCQEPPLGLILPIAEVAAGVEIVLLPKQLHGHLVLRLWSAMRLVLEGNLSRCPSQIQGAHERPILGEGYTQETGLDAVQ